MFAVRDEGRRCFIPALRTPQDVQPLRRWRHHVSGVREAGEGESQNVHGVNTEHHSNTPILGGLINPPNVFAKIGTKAVTNTRTIN